MIALAALNALPAAEFTATLARIFEHSPWVAEAVAGQRPFASIAALHGAMVAAVGARGEAAQRALLLAHPMLARPAKLTAESAGEQGGLGLQALDAAQAAAFDAANAAYAAKFGFPFIIAVRGQRDRSAILAAMRARLDNTPAEEHAAALAEVGKIAAFRLADLIAEA